MGAASAAPVKSPGLVWDRYPAALGALYAPPALAERWQARRRVAPAP
jgi:hypothetical protein